MEILSRYYFQSGKIIGALKSDPEIAEAIGLIHDTTKYAGILAGKFSQPDNSLPGSVQEEQEKKEGE